MSSNDPHNPDINPNWTPKVAWRVYTCAECGARTKLQTNHTGKVYANPCAGRCKDIYNPHTATERVVWHPDRVHKYVCEAE